MLRKLFNKLRPKKTVIPEGVTRDQRAIYRRERARKMHAMGLTPKEIAAELGTAQSTVYTYL